MAGISQQNGPTSLYKSLENFQETIDQSRQKELSKMAAMQEYTQVSHSAARQEQAYMCSYHKVCKAYQINFTRLLWCFGFTKL